MVPGSVCRLRVIAFLPLPRLPGVALPAGQPPPGRMELLPLPRGVLVAPLAPEQRCPARLLLALRSGTFPADTTEEADLADELANMPRVEVRRMGWLNA